MIKSCQTCLVPKGSSLEVLRHTAERVLKEGGLPNCCASCEKRPDGIDVFVPNTKNQKRLSTPKGKMRVFFLLLCLECQSNEPIMRHLEAQVLGGSLDRESLKGIH